MAVSKRRRYIEYQWERFYPAAVGGACGAAMVVFGPCIFAFSARHGVRLENSYVPIAGVFAIIAGFLASFYGSIQSIAESRLKRIAKTPWFMRFLRQIKEATIAGFFLSVLSLPVIVLAPDDPSSVNIRVFVAVWCGLSAYAFAAFIRVGTKLFYVFERQPPVDESMISPTK